MSEADTEIASKILSALTFSVPKENTIENKDSVPLEEQKRYLNRYIDSLSTEDRKAIGDILVMNNKRSALNWCSEGTVINLDTMPAYVIEQMHNLVYYKMSKRT